MFGAGTGEGEQRAGAASSKPSATTSHLATVRTRSQLESLRISKGGEEEELNEALLDEDSDAEMEDKKNKVEAVTRMDTDSDHQFTGMPPVEAATASQVAPEDLNEVFDETMESRDGTAAGTTTVLAVQHISIESGHATVKAARKVASSRRQLSPAPTTTESATFHTSFTDGGDECMRSALQHHSQFKR